MPGRLNVLIMASQCDLEQPISVCFVSFSVSVRWGLIIIILFTSRVYFESSVLKQCSSFLKH